MSIIESIFNLFSSVKPEKLKIDESKPLYIVKNEFDIIYFHMETYRVCKPIWYPNLGKFKIWRFEYNEYRQKLVEQGLEESKIISFDDWVLREHIGSDKLYKSTTAPKITHECEIFSSFKVPDEYDNCEFLSKLVKERYEKH